MLHQLNIEGNQNVENLTDENAEFTSVLFLFLVQAAQPKAPQPTKEEKKRRTR